MNTKNGEVLKAPRHKDLPNKTAIHLLLRSIRGGKDSPQSIRWPVLLRLEMTTLKLAARLLGLTESKAVLKSRHYTSTGFFVRLLGHFAQDS